MKYLFSRYKSGVTLSQFLPNSSQLAIVLSPIVQFCTKMAGERSSSEPPQEDSKGLRSEVGLCLTSSNWACPTMVEMYPMIQYVTRRDPNKFPRQNDDNGHQNFNAHDVDVNDNIWSGEGSRSRSMVTLLEAKKTLPRAVARSSLLFFLFKMRMVNYFSGEREQLRQMGTKSEKQTGCSSSQ